MNAIKDQKPHHKLEHLNNLTRIFSDPEEVASWKILDPNKNYLPGQPSTSRHKTGCRSLVFNQNAKQSLPRRHGVT